MSNTRDEIVEAGREWIESIYELTALPWWCGVHFIDEDGRESEHWSGTAESFFAGNLNLEVAEEELPHERADIHCHTIEWKDLRRALRKLRAGEIKYLERKGPAVANRLLKDGWDVGDLDALIQAAAFHELVYG